VCRSQAPILKNSIIFTGAMADVVKKFINPKFDNPIVQYLFGYVNILIGAGSTVVLQSSSIFTSTLTPMVGIGLVEVETVYPLFLGSNIGTTCTAFLAALTQSESENFKDTMQGSLVHLSFNIIGILMFYPIPFMR
jgi:sodium-dependent phosphate cotransporter